MVELFFYTGMFNTTRIHSYPKLEWKGFSAKISCLLIATTYKNKQVMVVDNASTDGSRGLLPQAPPTVITNPVSEGFAQGYNVR